MDCIKFYRTKDNYGCFSNFSRHEVEIDGKVWPTSEHYYQAMKFFDPEVQEQVRLCQGPGRAADMGRRRDLPLREDWEEVKDDVMRKVLRAKFEQNDAIRRILMDTNCYLIEESPVDYYWGVGADRSGKNMLGRLLCELREEFKNDG